MLPESFRVICVLILIICINGFHIKISAKPRRKSHVTWRLNKNSYNPITNFNPFDNNEEKAAAIGDEVTIGYQNNYVYLESENNGLINDESNIVAPLRNILLPQLELGDEPSSKRIIGPLVEGLITPFPKEFVQPLQQPQIAFNTLPRGLDSFHRLNNDFAPRGLFSIDIIDEPRKLIPRKQYNVVYNKIDMDNVLPYRKQTFKNINKDINNKLAIPKKPIEKEKISDRNLKLLYRGHHGNPVKNITPPPKKLYVIIEDFPSKPKRQKKKKKARESHRQKKAPSLLDFNAFSLAKVPKQKNKQKPTSTHDDDDKSIALDLFKKVRVLCWVLTHPPNHNITTKPIRQTWGRRCNKLLFISSVEDDGTPSARASEDGSEHQWPNVKAAFMYVYNHHRNDAEWFLRADDDTYVIMENLRYMLSDYNSRDPLYFGCKAVEGNSFDLETNYMNGGAGMVLSKNAINRLMNKGFFGAQLCRNSEESDFKSDLKLGLCLHRVGVKAMDTKDAQKKARFMPLPAQDIVVPPDVINANDSYWRRTFRPPQVGLSCCSDFAISFHYVSPKDMYALEYLIYHVRPFGIKFGEAGMPSLLLNNTETSFGISALPKIPENPYQLNVDEIENPLYSKHKKDLADERNILIVQRKARQRGSVGEKNLKIVWNARDTSLQGQEKVPSKKKTVKIKPVITTPKEELDIILDETTDNPLNRCSNSNDENEISANDETKKLNKCITQYTYNIDYNVDKDNAEDKYTKIEKENDKYRWKTYQESVADNSKSNISNKTMKSEVNTEEYYKLTDLVSNQTISKSEELKKENIKGNTKKSKRVKKILSKPKTKSNSKITKYKHRIYNYQYIDAESTTNMEDLIAPSTDKLNLSERYFREQFNDAFEYIFDKKNPVVREMSDPEISTERIEVTKVDATKYEKDLDSDDNIEEKIDKIQKGNITDAVNDVEWVTFNSTESSLNKIIESDKDALVTKIIDNVVENDKYDQLDEKGDSLDNLGEN